MFLGVVGIFISLPVHCTAQHISGESIIYLELIKWRLNVPQKLYPKIQIR